MGADPTSRSLRFTGRSGRADGPHRAMRLLARGRVREKIAWSRPPLLDRLGIASVAERLHDDSAANAQLVAMGTRAGEEPQLIVLDEPTANFSTSATRQVMRGSARWRLRHRVLFTPTIPTTPLRAADRPICCAEAANASRGTTREEIH